MEQTKSITPSASSCVTIASDSEFIILLKCHEQFSICAYMFQFQRGCELFRLTFALEPFEWHVFTVKAIIPFPKEHQYLHGYQTHHFIPLSLSLSPRWDPKKRMTPEEAARHEWLQPSATSTYVSSKSKENASATNGDGQQLGFMQKLQRSQPMTPNTILPEIKTPSQRQRYVKDRVKGESRRISQPLRFPPLCFLESSKVAATPFCCETHTD